MTVAAGPARGAAASLTPTAAASQAAPLPAWLAGSLLVRPVPPWNARSSFPVILLSCCPLLAQARPVAKM